MIDLTARFCSGAALGCLRNTRIPANKNQQIMTTAVAKAIQNSNLKLIQGL
jgi:hypothetical protein